MSISFKNILEVDEGLQSDVLKWRNSDDVRRAMIHQHQITQEEHRNWLAKLASNSTQKCWVVFTDNIPVGIVSLAEIDTVQRRASWGFYIGRSDYRGKGLGKKILFKFFEMIFTKFDIDTLHTTVLTDNASALSLYRKFGFQEKGQKPFHGDVGLIVMEFTSQDWDVNKAALATEIGIHV